MCRPADTASGIRFNVDQSFWWRFKLHLIFNAGILESLNWCVALSQTSNVPVSLSPVSPLNEYCRKKFDFRHTFTRPFGALAPLWSHAQERKIYKTIHWRNIYKQQARARSKDAPINTWFAFDEQEKMCYRQQQQKKNQKKRTAIYFSLVTAHFPRHPIDINTRIFVINFSIRHSESKLTFRFPQEKVKVWRGKKMYALNMNYICV